MFRWLVRIQAPNWRKEWDIRADDIEGALERARLELEDGSVIVGILLIDSMKMEDWLNGRPT